MLPPPALLHMQFKAVKPVGDRVLVKVDKEEQKSIGGVLLPTAAQSRPTAGAVVAAGDVSLVKVRVAWLLLAPAAAVAEWRERDPSRHTPPVDTPCRHCLCCESVSASVCQHSRCLHYQC